MDQIDRLLIGVETQGQIEPGLFEQSLGGTLYLDEISSFPIQQQKEILKMLLDGGITRVGGKELVYIDARVLASCSGYPKDRVSEGVLREDLYHRLNVVTPGVPGLQKRRDDIPYLVEHFARILASQMNMPMREAGHDVMAVLQSHSWPGNVRQLRNCIEHMMLSAHAANSDSLTTEHLHREILSKTDVAEDVSESRHMMSFPLRDARECFERDYLVT